MTNQKKDRLILAETELKTAEAEIELFKNTADHIKQVKKIEIGIIGKYLGSGKHAALHAAFIFVVLVFMFLIIAVLVDRSMIGEILEFLKPIAMAAIGFIGGVLVKKEVGAPSSPLTPSPR